MKVQNNKLQFVTHFWSNLDESLPIFFLNNNCCRFCAIMSTDHFFKEKNFENIEYFTDSINILKNSTRPRFAKTHLPWNLLPKQIISGEKQPKANYYAFFKY